MTDQLIVINDKDDQSENGRLAKVEEIGRIANQVAADHARLRRLSQPQEQPYDPDPGRGAESLWRLSIPGACGCHRAVGR